MNLGAVLRCALCMVVSMSAAAAERGVTAGECQRHFAQDAMRLQRCVAHAAAQPAVAPPPTDARQTPGLASPLAHLLVIFGFYDRRFPAHNGWLEHAGVDFTAAAGTAVYAICNGTVALARTDNGTVVSAVLVVEHQCPEPLGKVYAYYGHIHSELKGGDAVSAGDGIGTVRDWQSNSHLHFGLSRHLLEEWGTYPRGVTLSALEDQGWLNPLHYFPAARNGGGNGGGELKRVAPKPAVNRQHRPGNVTGKRRR